VSLIVALNVLDVLEAYSTRLYALYTFIRRNVRLYGTYSLVCTVGKLKAACAAVASFLLFLPADETMLRNRDYYSALPKVKEEEYFEPREVSRA